LSKNARDLLQEFSSQTDIADDFQLHVLKVNVSESGEVEPAGNAQPVITIDIDSENKECLLHFDEATSEPVTVADIKALFVNDVLDYEVCASQEKDVDDAVIRLDTPLIGFGEIVETKVFFVVCQV
jgi:hypothetical protein